MTLLFTYIDDNYVMQMSDERISVWNSRTRAWDVRDDQTRKQILVRGSLLISFTGVAELEGSVPTTEWLARWFGADVAMDQIAADIARRLTSIFGRSRYREQVLVVLIAGWVETERDDLVPIFGHISNQHPVSLERMSSFDHLVGTLDPGAIWVTRGQELPVKVENELRRNINTGLSAGISPPVMQRLFLKAMRACAANNRFVGPSALIGVLPRAAVTRGQADPDNFWVFTNNEGALIPGAAMFVRIPAGTDHTEPFRPFVV